MIIWEDCTPKSSGGVKEPKYDVMVSLTKQTRASSDDRLNHDIGFTFRNKGYRAVEDSGYGIISKILPNTERIYFQFLPDTSISKKVGRKLSILKDSKSKRLQVPVKSVTTYQVVSGYWLGEYRLEYDDAEGYYYISNDGRY